MTNREILLKPDSFVHGISNFIKVSSIEDLNEHMDLIQSEKIYYIELIFENDSNIESFNATGYVGVGTTKDKRTYEAEFFLKNKSNFIDIN